MVVQAMTNQCKTSCQIRKMFCQLGYNDMGPLTQFTTAFEGLHEHCLIPSRQFIDYPPPYQSVCFSFSITKSPSTILSSSILTQTTW